VEFKSRQGNATARGTSVAVSTLDGIKLFLPNARVDSRLRPNAHPCTAPFLFNIDLIRNKIPTLTT
jgi:hypothetical protein